ncbi:hypothetical protein K1T71_009371 [Dendrolimus kikuchii]|uniref:Uncharacterized protein n=1 Tax=Dendrolimus kikuchii TaxID=765133 RepID=A0ACC1CUD5_9NEOP|nr:hypothetical protein K1T71_009371 [Dendrolimus kikuchii]
MKKFIREYKALQCFSDTNATEKERLTVTTRHNADSAPAIPDGQHADVTQIGTIRTEEYKRDLAEFQARRSSGPKDLQETPVKKKCGRHSLPVSCTDCATDHDNTFSYEKKSAIKYKQSKRRGRSTTPEQGRERVPNIQFLFQNQVFMPGNVFAASSYSEPRRRQSRRKERSPEMDLPVQRHIDFKDDNGVISPPNFYKNSSLPFDIKNFRGSQGGEDAVDGSNSDGDVKKSSRSSSTPRKDDSGDDKLWEVMSELNHFDQWADEQLEGRSHNVSKSDDSKSDTSAYGLPVASPSDIDLTSDGNRTWNHGKWGVVPVQVKKLAGVTAEHVRKKRNAEINILRKYRHPNIILLMGLFLDVHDNINIICERCVDSLFGIIHEQGRILSAQSAVHYTLDVANALAFLRMQGYVHTGLTSVSIMVTSHDAAKLVDFGPCVKLSKARQKKEVGYYVYSPEPRYVNIEDSRQSTTADYQPLISEHPSEVYINSNAVAKPYKMYEHSDLYAWQAPELFVPDENGLVYPCSKSDVYSLCIVLWECCNAKIPFKSLNYDKLKEHYTLWKTGISLPQDGTYPGCLLSLLQHGLKLQRSERIDLDKLQGILQNVKSDLDDIGYVIIPARLPSKKTTFSATNWTTTTTSPSDSDCLSPQNVHEVIVHKPKDSSTESEKDCSKSSTSPIYESILQSKTNTVYAEKCFISDEETVDDRPLLKYDLLPDNDYSSACSTPIAKIKARIKDMETPGTFHRSDSTEYCSILSPNRTNLGLNDDSHKDSSSERPAAKLSRSFTPKSYKPLHIKVPECNLDGIKPLLKDRNSTEKPSYNFDIKNYSLPTTPIARSNKLRKNAWLSGDLSFPERCSEKIKECIRKSPGKSTEDLKVQSTSETPVASMDSSLERTIISKTTSPTQNCAVEESPKSVDTGRDSYTGLKRVDPPHDFISTETGDSGRERTNSWSFHSNTTDRTTSKYIDEAALANMNVKPLVAIHERWIYEANRKPGRSMSLPEDNRARITAAVKPASHCVDTLQNSLPQLNVKRATAKIYRTHPPSPKSVRAGLKWDQFCQARETVAKNVNFTVRNAECSPIKKTDIDKSTSMDEIKIEPKTDQATDTTGIEDFIRDLIRKEFQNLVHEVSDDASTISSMNHKNEDILNKGVSNIMESLNSNEEAEKNVRKEQTKSFSRLKINGNNKPLLQITFSRSGENSLHVLDKNCVNVTICDSNGGRDKLNVSLEDTVTGDDGFVNSLKRCQAFSAIQEAKSTEDLYIDDDLSTHMQENFGGKVKLIPLHGSLHEILCEKEDDCCLIKVKQENGCDTIYFRCDNSDADSRDAIDGTHDNLSQDTVVFKRSISLIEERIQRVIPKEKKISRKPLKIRPKSEIFVPIRRESRVMSNSSPSLNTQDDKDVEVNIENVMCYQDSSSDECLKSQENDDFELLERKIEEDMANNLSMNCGCLEKISEENLSSLTEDGTDKD